MVDFTHVKKIYYADLSYGTSRLSSYVVERETERTYTIKLDSQEDLIDHVLYVPDRLRKADSSVFDNLADALNHLIRDSIEYRNGLSRALENVERNIKELQIILKENSNGPTQTQD